MKNLPVPEGYTVTPKTHFMTSHDTSRLPHGLMGTLNARVSSRYPDDTRSDKMASEIADELLVGSCMYGNHQIPGISVGSYDTLYQVVDYAWNRTFAERLEEAVQRYRGVSRDELRRDLTEAWWNIQQIITPYDTTS